MLFTHLIVSLLLTTLTTWGLGCFVVFKNRNSRVNVTFALYSFSIGWWSLGQIGLIASYNHEIALIYGRWMHLGVWFIPTFFLHFVFELLDIKTKNTLTKACYGLSIIFAGLSPTTLMMPDAIPKFYVRYFVTAGPVYSFGVAFFFAVVTYGLYLLFREYLSSTGVKRNQLSYLCWSSLAGYLGGTPNFLLVYNINTPVLNPFGTYAVPAYIAATTYAIIAYRLMDITILARDTLVHVLVAFTSALAVSIVGMWFIPESYLLLMILLVLATAVLTPVLYFKLNKRYKSFVDKYVFQNRWDYHKRLQDIGDKAFSIYSLKELLDTVVKDVAAALGTDTCYALIREGRTDTFHLWAHTGLSEELSRKYDVVAEGNDFIQALVVSKRVLVKEDLMAVGDGRHVNGNKEVVKALDERGCAVVVPLCFNDKLSGVLALGTKNNRRMYTHKDVELLEKLSRDVSHAYGFLSIIYDQALLTARTAHDAKQPLSGAGYRLMNILNGLYGRGSDREKEELMDVKERVLFVGEFFSDLMELNNMVRLRLRGEYEFAAYDMAELLRFIVDGLKPVAGSKGLELRLLYPDGLPKGIGVSSSVQRALSNLITNSIKFTMKGFVEVAVRGDGECIEVKITDTGPGMNEEDVNNLFVPFHKIGGKKNFVEGAGLGLTIVKEVLDVHKGRIKVKSKLGEGTEFIVSWPALREDNAPGTNRLEGSL